MNLLFMKSSYSPIPFILERQMIKTGLLMSQNYTTVTPSLTPMAVYNNRTKASLKQIIQNYKFFFTNLGEGFGEEELDLFYNSLSFLRNKKFKNRDETITWDRMEHTLVMLKGEIERASMFWFNTHKLDVLINFYAEEKLIIFDEGSELKVDENFFVNYLMEEILEPDKFHFFMTNQELMVEALPTEVPFNANESIRLFSSVLFEIPCLDSFTYNQLIIIRNEFQEQLIPFFKAIKALQAKLNTFEIDEGKYDNAQLEFDEIIDPYQKFFKTFIDNNIYFQQIKNSSEAYKKYHLIISFSSLDNLIALYGNAGVIDKIQYENLCEKIAYTKDIHSGIIFFEMSEITAE